MQCKGSEFCYHTQMFHGLFEAKMLKNIKFKGYFCGLSFII